MSQADSKLDGRGVFVQKQTANIYTMLLILSFLAIVLGCVFLYLEMQAYEWKVTVPQELKPPPVAAHFAAPLTLQLA